MTPFLRHFQFLLHGLRFLKKVLRIGRRIGLQIRSKSDKHICSKIILYRVQVPVSHHPQQKFASGKKFPAGWGWLATTRTSEHIKSSSFFEKLYMSGQGIKLDTIEIGLGKV